MTRHLDDYRCSAKVSSSFQKTVPRKTADNTVKHHNGGVVSVVVNHRDGGESLVVVTALIAKKVTSSAGYSNHSSFTF